MDDSLIALFVDGPHVSLIFFLMYHSFNACLFTCLLASVRYSAIPAIIINNNRDPKN